MFAETCKIVPLITSANVGATSDTDSIHITGAHKITVIYTCGAFTGNGTFSFSTGTSNGTKTNYVPFKYALGTAAVGSTTSDLLVAWTAATTTAAVTCTTKMLVCEIDCAAVTAGDTYLTGTIAATAGICHGVAIIEPRYAKELSPTVV